MNSSGEIPDEITRGLSEADGDLSRRAVEGLVVEELRAGRIGELELAEMLGLGRLAMERFLKAHEVYLDLTIEDVDRDIADLKKLGL